MSLGATAGRMRASSGLVAASAVMVLVTCTLVALVPIYSTAIVDAGLRATIADADASTRTIDATLRASAADVEAVVGPVDGLLTPDASAFDTVAFAESGAYRFVSPEIDTDPAAGTSVITSLATFVGDDLFAADGDLDSVIEAPSTPTTDWPTAIHRDAATLIGVDVGDRIEVRRANSDAGDPIGLTVAALVEPVDAADPRWFSEPFGRLGVTTSGSFTEVGPLFVGRAAFATLDDDVTSTVRFALDDAAVSAATIDDLIATVEAADDSIGTALAPHNVRVETDLDTLLDDTDTSVRSTSAVVAAILLQLTAVALYGLGVAAAVLVASRQRERVLLNSRGISTGRVARDALIEGAVIALPAAILGPLCAVAAVRVAGSWGPLAATGLELRPQVSFLGYALSFAAAAIGVAVIAWPAINATRSPVTDTTRPAVPFLRRTGLDIVLFVVAVLGLWQLQRTGTVATSAAPGSRASIDPVLVLAPTLGVAAASLLAIRALSVAARALERAGSRSRRLAPALAGWEAAREGARRDRSSILVVISVAVATFALIHAVSWERSQQDQANASVGADIVVTPDLRPDAGVPPASLASQYRGIDGVEDVAPIDDRTVAISSTLGAVPLVAVDTRRFDEFARLRSDLAPSEEDLAALSDPAALGAVDLPAAGGPTSADITVLATTVDPASGTSTATPADVDLALVVVDEFGTFHRLGADEPVGATSGGADPAPRTVGFGTLEASSSVPPRLVEIEVAVDIPFVDPTQEFDTDGDGVNDFEIFDLPGERIEIVIDQFRVGDVAVDVAAADWTGVVTDPRRSTITPMSADAAVSRQSDVALELEIDTGTTTQRSASDRVRFVTAQPVDPMLDDVALDVLATPTLLDELGVAVGDTSSARIGGLRVPLRIVGTTDAIPFAVDEPSALLADHATLAAIDYLATGAQSPPDRWALVVDADLHDAVGASLRALPFASRDVADRWADAERRTRDPVLVGLTGSLLMAIVAVGVVALVGLGMSAVTGARDRRSAHAVLRALGASRRELRRWLFRETVPLGVLATLIGAVAGAAIAALVLTSLTGDRDGTAAIPPPVFVVPLVAVGLVVAVAVLAIVLLPLSMSRLLRGVRPADELRIGGER